MYLPSQNSGGAESFSFTLQPQRGGYTLGMYVSNDKFTKIKMTGYSGARSIKYYIGSAGYNFSTNVEVSLTSSFYIEVTSGTSGSTASFTVYN